MKALSLILVSLLSAAAWTIVLFALASCSHAALPPVVRSLPVSGIPMHYWTIDFEATPAKCEPFWLSPATYCNLRNYELRHDGCHWRCVYVEPPQ